MRIFGKGKCELTAIVRIFGMGKCKLIANFSATMMTSLPSISLSLSLSLCISLSLSLSLSHRAYLTHNIGSAFALPIIILELSPVTGWKFKKKKKKKKKKREQNKKDRSST